MTEYADEMIDQMIDGIFETKDEPVFVCRQCGKRFHSDKKAPTLCPDCLAEALRKGGRKSAEKFKAKAKPAPKADPPPDPKPEQVPEIRTPVTLTVGVFRRLLDGVPEDAALRIDGNPVRTVFVEHYYDLEHGTERYSVELDL